MEDAVTGSFRVFAENLWRIGGGFAGMHWKVVGLGGMSWVNSQKRWIRQVMRPLHSCSDSSIVKSESYLAVQDCLIREL